MKLQRLVEFKENIFQTCIVEDLDGENIMEILVIKMIGKGVQPGWTYHIDLGLSELQCKLLETNLLTQLQHVKHRKILKDKPLEDISILFGGGDTGYRDIEVHMSRQQAQEIIKELTSVKKYLYHLWIRGEKI